MLEAIIVWGDYRKISPKLNADTQELVKFNTRRQNLVDLNEPSQLTFKLDGPLVPNIPCRRISIHFET